MAKTPPKHNPYDDDNLSNSYWQRALNYFRYMPSMTTQDLIPVLALIASLQAKHFICDGLLQTKAMVDSKSVYGDRMGLVHAAIHGIGTVLILAVFVFKFSLVLGLAVLDMVIHYHVDYAKENIVKRSGWSSHDAKFWWALSADQMLHQFTYLLLAGLAFTA
jgi:Protein of unknown function (DUF3307)